VAVGGRPGSVEVIFDEIEMSKLLRGPQGPVWRVLETKGEVVTQGAKRRAPVSPDGSNGRPSGYMRSEIHWKFGEDTIGLYVDIISPAETEDGEPYGLFVEVGTVEHDIISHGKYPLRNRRTGQVFGKIVHHPGTAPQPYLRPALEDMRGA
jgi:hypothetical protein